ncbi:uracil-DNA glycosylase [Acidiluteibacter ferrifornacis]|uniref:Uracil-DNA glycosylase n=1 Tax=Acidiluteibacter ferrifornacis TaxID=2692424 RepID=A0A6N9NJ59_9FLAO|nr:uracil-DNA glycosylase [Acidiluteibacter ferrifornacis]MBR9832174.1 uracil-DNA glycosylase [bacterium]NBG65889.1 uracil-DNA glycosylase [Acidiluteibacter ferrifornacis]
MRLKEKEWKKWLNVEFEKEYYLSLSQFLEQEYSNKTIYPPREKIFAALDNTPPDEIKVVIIGQDPYHQKNQANGLAFSVENDVPLPPSLKNIFQELKMDVGVINYKSDLLSWAKQGVLLLNTVLTVEEGKADAHKNKGWEKFTDAIIKQISENRKGIIFLLWGSKAIKKKNLIDSDVHYILEAPHPSPLSSYRGFFGCKHFSKSNNILKKMGKKPINWQT